ncbi:hypothetical protein KY336_04000, partial [Candidatus Woesearchaeota archaeon]|nr:hypothetical protein [Candidatus Woesearchaeota archaeon]
MDISKHAKWIILFLFILGVALRLQVDGIYVDNPGTIKAADAFYYVLSAENIAETGKYGYFPYYITDGSDDMIDAHVPLMLISGSGLTSTSGLKAWNTVYILVCIIFSLPIIIAFYFAKRLFNSDHVGILASSILVVPLFIGKWWYLMYIGMWTTAIGIALAFVCFWLVYECVNAPKDWKYIMLGLVSIGTLLFHFQDLIMIAPLILFVFFNLWKIHKLTKDFFKKIGMILIPNIFFFIFYFSRFYTVFTSGRSSFGWQNQVFTNAPYYVNINHLGYLLLGLALLGLLLMCLNYKKYIFFIGTCIYFSFYLYIFPKITAAAFDIMRSRFIIIFIAALFIAYAIYFFVINIHKYLKLPKITMVLAIVTIFIVAGLPGQFALVEQMKSQHLTPEKYSVMLWIQENTPKDARIFFLDGYFQHSNYYSKRVSTAPEIPELQKHINKFFATQNLSLEFNTGLGMS